MGTPYRRAPRISSYGGFPRPQYTIGAMRDQHGNLQRTPEAIPGGAMSLPHDWTAFDKAFARPAATAPAAPAVAPGAVNPALAIAGMGPGAVAANAGAFTRPADKPQVTAAPANVTPPSTRQTTDGRTEYLDQQTGRYVQSTGPDKSFAPPATGRAPLVNPTAQVKAVTPQAPLTGPNGNATTDAANLAANKSLYAPGGTVQPVSAYDRPWTPAPGDFVSVKNAAEDQNMAGQANSTATRERDPSTGNPVAVADQQMITAGGQKATAENAAALAQNAADTKAATATGMVPAAQATATRENSAADDELRRQASQATPRSAYDRPAGGGGGAGY